MKKLFCLSLGLAMVAVTSCSDPKKLKEDYPKGEKGTSEAITGEDTHLTEPRPAPMGDTAETKSQADQFGEHNVENVDSTARGLK
jgi:hypothetical protein